MELILCRLTWSLKKASQHDKTEAKIGCLALVRTFVSLRHWILNHFQDDFVDNVQIRQLFTHTLNEVSHHSVFTNAKTSLQTKVIVDLKKSYLKLCHIFWSSIKLPTDPQIDYLEYQIPALETIQSSRLSTLGLKQLRNPSVRRQSVLSLMGKRSSNGTNQLLQEYDDMVKKEGKSLEKILKARSARHDMTNPKVGNSFEANDKFILYPKASMYSLRQSAQLGMTKSDTMDNLYSEILQGVKYTPVPGVKHLDAPGRNMDVDAGFIIKGQVEVFTSAKIKRLACDAPLKKLSDGPVLGDENEKKVVVKEEKRRSSMVNALSPGKRKKSMARMSMSAPASPKKQKKKFLKMFKGKDKHNNNNSTNTNTTAAAPNSKSRTVSSPNPNTKTTTTTTAAATTTTPAKTTTETKEKHSTLNLKDLDPIILYNTNTDTTTQQSSTSKSQANENENQTHEQYDLLSSRILSDFQAITGIYNFNNGSATGSTTGHGGNQGPISRSTTNRSLQDYLDVKSRGGSVFNFDKLMAGVGVGALDSPTKHRGGVFGGGGISPSKSKFSKNGAAATADVNGGNGDAGNKGRLTKLDPGSNVTLDRHDAVLAAVSGDADVSADVSGVSAGDILDGYGSDANGHDGDILGGNDGNGDNDSFDMLSGGSVASFKSPSVTMNWSNSLDLNGSSASIIDLNGNSTKEELAPGGGVVCGGDDVEKKAVDADAAVAVDEKKKNGDGSEIGQVDIENISVMKDEPKIQELKDDDDDEEDGVILPSDDKTKFHMVHQTPTTTPQLQQQPQLQIPKTRIAARSVPASESTAVDSPNLGGFGSGGLVGGAGGNANANANVTQLSHGLSDRFSVRIISRNSIMSAKSYITYDSELSLNENSRGYGGYGRYGGQADDDDGYKLKKKSSVVDLRISPTDEHGSGSNDNVFDDAFGVTPTGSPVKSKMKQQVMEHQLQKQNEHQKLAGSQSKFSVTSDEDDEFFDSFADHDEMKKSQSQSHGKDHSPRKKKSSGSKESIGNKDQAANLNSLRELPFSVDEFKTPHSSLSSALSGDTTVSMVPSPSPSQSCLLPYPGISQTAIAELAAIPDEIFEGNPVDYALSKLRGKGSKPACHIEIGLNDEEHGDGRGRHTHTTSHRLGHVHDAIFGSPCKTPQRQQQNRATMEESDQSMKSIDEVRLEKRVRDLFISTTGEGGNKRESTPLRYSTKLLKTDTRRMSKFDMHSLSSTPHKQLAAQDKYVSVEECMYKGCHMPFILGFDTRVLVEQFTLIERDLLQQLDWKELIDLTWDKPLDPYSSWINLLLESTEKTGIHIITLRFNLMTNWIISEVLLAKNLNVRVATISKFIRLAEYCKEIQNFATMFQITLALSSNIVKSLKMTWSHVPPLDLLIFKTLKDLSSSNRNFANFRNLLDSMESAKGLIPFTPLELSDLTANSEKPSIISADISFAETDEIEGYELVNVEKFTVSCTILKKLLRSIDWSNAYDFKVDQDVLSRCLYISCLSEEEMEYCRGQLIDP
ncbi:unnamed protein product [Ambrosiozyma monospora]|uniref:Unnamed protein product n=1 Tax=Ambrosiozyma monospora TaxID=43982 RepID=A0A9W6YSU3_AMBMO|nr:unnamed protein product [Ambrosiozyma monospora]